MEDVNGVNDALFMQLVMGLHGSAWMMLGKVMNPLTEKMEKNLDGAKAGIDTLMMLKDKTRGNLSKTEDEFLSNIIQQLQINYVEETKLEKTVDSEKKKTNEKEKDEKEKKGKK